MKAAWRHLIHELESDPTQLLTLFSAPLEPADALVLEELEGLLRQSAEVRLERALAGEAEMLPSAEERRALMANLRARQIILDLLGNWGGSHPN